MSTKSDVTFCAIYKCHSAMAGRRRLGVYAQLFGRRDSGAQLAVTARNIERLDGTYAFESERLLEKPQYQWPSHMAGKANSNASIAAIRHNRNAAAALSGNKYPGQHKKMMRAS